jgi:NADPH:quinone reductase-like Zn-dependent oxidoreductase
MAAITLSTAAHRVALSGTPLHLRHQLAPPVDWSSHLKPPVKVGSTTVLVQIYAVAVDELDIKILEEKGKADVGKWVPGRSFVGRCLMVSTEEKDIVRGDIVVGLLDSRKVGLLLFLGHLHCRTNMVQSGALCEYILCERRRVARAPFPTSLSLEQMALLPLHGIPAARITRTHLVRHSRALIMDAHHGVGALICQEMARAGVNVTAVIGGGDDHYECQSACMAHGAKGVLTGSPAAVMLQLDEGGWDFVLDTIGGQRVYDTAKRILKDGAK